MFSQVINKVIRKSLFHLLKPAKISKFKLLTLGITGRNLNRKHNALAAVQWFKTNEALIIWQRNPLMFARETSRANMNENFKREKPRTLKK